MDKTSMLYLTPNPTGKDADVERSLRAADGYLSLGLPGEALHELDHIPSPRLKDSLVLRTRIRILLYMKLWKQAGQLAKEGASLFPGEDQFMVQRAFALHQQERETEAAQVILQAPEWLKRTGILQYNLACYEAQLGDLRLARQCINAAFQLNAAFKINARNDPDLQPLWS